MRFKGAKCRAQNSSAAEEVQPLSSASYTLNQEAHLVPNDHVNPSVPFTRHDNIGHFPMPAQSHNDTENLVGFDVQHLIPSDYNGPNLLSPQSQPGWSTVSCPNSSESPTSSRIAASTSSQDVGGFFTAESPVSDPLTEISANNTWNVRPSPGPQWPLAGISHNSMQTENFWKGSNVHPDGNHRPQSRCRSSRPSTTSTVVVEQGTALRSAPRGNEMEQSSQERYQRSPHAHRQYLSNFQSANSHTEHTMTSVHANSFHRPLNRTGHYRSSRTPYQLDTDFRVTRPLSPAQATNTHCSHCSCINHPASPLASSKVTKPGNLALGPTRSVTRTSSQDLEILSECNQALRNLVHAPVSNNLVDKRQSRSGETTDEGHDGRMGRWNGLEKVIVMYVNGKFEGSGN